MVRRFSILSVVTVCLVLTRAQLTGANTILVTDLTADPLTGVYTYSVQFSDSAVVSDTGPFPNGFVLYDFQGLDPATIASQVSFVFTSPVPAGAKFVPSVQYTGNAISPGLDLELRNVLDLSDSPSIYNLSLVYKGPTIIGSATGILKVTSNVNGPGASTVTIGVVSLDAAGGLFAASGLTGPNGATVPLPASFVGGGVLMLGLAVARFSSRAIASRSALIA
jgi:hypothetical protein